MTDEASPAAVGTAAGGPIPPVPSFEIRKVPLPTAAERQARRDAMERAIRFGATPYRDAEGSARYVSFKEATNAAVEAWRRDPGAKRGFRKVQQARKAAGQLIGHPEDQIELAKRLGVMHYREGRSPEGAAERGLHDAIWRHEHVFGSFTVPRRFGRDIIETGRIAAVAQEEARKLQAEDPRALGGFWVRDRKNSGLIYVVPHSGPVVAEPVAAPQASPLSPAGGSAPSSPQSIQAPGPATADDYFSDLRQNLAPREGGRANRPPQEDRGGKTNKGVTQDTLNRLHQEEPSECGHYPSDPFMLTDQQIDTILRKEYFDPLHMWEISQIPGLLSEAPQLAEQLFDMGVLHGIDDPARILQESLYEIMGIDLRVMKNGELKYDAVIGPATRKVLALALAAGKAVALNNLMVDKRLIKLNLQGEKASNPGWFPRAESFRILSSPPAGNPGSP